uniref:rRNA adenine N(6)-methyltransferase n=1 Tax=Heterorhabditis bacteriophora TaxID=37862 RepID=A0A1I7XHQ4_HETBA
MSSDEIVRSAGVKEGDWVAEIGPGPGGITRGILEAGCHRLDVIEIDGRFIPPLQHLAEAAGDRMHIHHADVLKTDVGSIWRTAKRDAITCEWHDPPPNLHIIGNLPFNIASPLIIKYLKEMSYRTGPWSMGRVALTLTFQLEVARRLCSPIACSTRSRISIMAQYVSEPKMLFQIPGSCFVPRPDVDVGVVRFVPRVEPLINTSFEVVEKVCRQIFHYRQKYVIKGLKTLYPPELAHEMSHQLLADCRIDPTTTSIRLGIEQFADLAVGYEKQCKSIQPGHDQYAQVIPMQTINHGNGVSAMPSQMITLQPGASGVVWMSVPQSIDGVPQGLEYLTLIDTIVVYQLYEILELITGFETTNKYMLKNVNGEQEILVINRPFKCCGGGCFGLVCSLDSCSQEVTIEVPSGTIVSIYHMYCVFLFIIRHCCATQCMLFKSIRYKRCEWHKCFKDSWSMFLCNVWMSGQGICIPMDLDVKMKAVLIGATFLIVSDNASRYYIYFPYFQHLQ